jgi:hypothetical protein
LHCNNDEIIATVSITSVVLNARVRARARVRVEGKKIIEKWLKT